MPNAVRLRAVEPGDLPLFYEHQLDPEGGRMAAFASRDRDAFMAHWTKILADPACATRTILLGDQVAGNVGAWTDADSGERMVCYWIGRGFWGRGIASAALAQMVVLERVRPLTARVAIHNVASLRVLQKCGFVTVGKECSSDSDPHPVEEFVLKLG